MRRRAIVPRVGWEQKVSEAGLIFHTPQGRPYWNESACYEFTAAEIERLESATNELMSLYLQLGDHVIARDRFAELGIEAPAAALIRKTWEAEPPSIYGRFDLAFDGIGAPKLLEFNADTPTSLLEAAVVQWFWLRETHPDADQWNGIHERLIEKWRELAAWERSRATDAPQITFLFSEETSHEDAMTVGYLMDTAISGGWNARMLNVADVGVLDDAFIDREGWPITNVFKLYPWEWLLGEQFGTVLMQTVERGMHFWMEPIWKLMWSNKAVLPLLWELFPHHPNLLPAYADGPHDLRDYVVQPAYSREGANVTLVEDGVAVGKTEGDYVGERLIYQARASLFRDGDRHAVLGAWVVDGAAAGMGIREGGIITDNLAQFVPHLIAD